MSSIRDGESKLTEEGSISVGRSDFDWLVEKAALALELDFLCTTDGERDRLRRIVDRGHA